MFGIFCYRKVTPWFKITLKMATTVGKLFTSDTFSKYYTKEVILFLDPSDIRNLSVVNVFCNTMCKDEAIQKSVIQKNLKLGYAIQNELLRFRLTEDQVFSLYNFSGRLSTIGDNFCCLHLKDSCVILNKTTFEIHKTINAKLAFG
jgi:hypothetical protein